MTAALEAPPQVASLNIADRIRQQAELLPFAKAVIAPAGYLGKKRTYAHLTFRQLDQLIDRYASGLQAMGIHRQMRVLLLVKPSLEFFGLTFALFRLGAVPVLLDPAMGKKNVVGAIAEVEPEALIAIPRGHLAKTLFPSAFSSVKVSIIVGKKLLFGGSTLDDVVALGSDAPFKGAATQAEDMAAILFTSGSTGAPKGVVYTHGIFDAQVEMFERDFGIEAGEVDLSAFPLFSLFSAALGVSVVIPDMDHTKAALVDGNKIVEAVEDQGVTYAFGSPAFWHRVADHCESTGHRFRSLTRILMAGAPAPASLLERLLRLLPEGGDVFTPYGATECLPISLPSAKAIVAGKRSVGRGTYVGPPIQRLRVKIIRITEEKIPTLDQAEELRSGEIGEILVNGPVSTKSYFRRDEDTARSKIRDGDVIWHRMGDVGWLDEDGSLWFCGRKAHRVETADGPRYSVCCEQVFNEHPDVYRSALVGLGPRGDQKPVIVVELHDHAKRSAAIESALLDRARSHPLTEQIDTVLFHPSFPVDARHNAKIRREDLAVWADKALRT